MLLSPQAQVKHHYRVQGAGIWLQCPHEKGMALIADTPGYSDERSGIHRWETHEPYYGIRRQMRPLLARLRGTRNLFRFRIFAAKAIK